MMADGSFVRHDHHGLIASTATDAAGLLRTVPMSLWPESVRHRRAMLELATYRAEQLLAEIVERLAEEL